MNVDPGYIVVPNGEVPDVPDVPNVLPNGT